MRCCLHLRLSPNRIVSIISTPACPSATKLSEEPFA
jgi:hypothetical protein